MRVRDVMTQDVATIAPDTDLRDLAALLVEKRISGVPVVEGGRVVGVVSERDILFKERPSDGLSRGVLAWLMDEGDLTLKIDARTVREAMTSPPLTIAPSRGVADAAATMLDENVSRLPVVDHGRLVGIVTRRNLVRAFARSDEADSPREIDADPTHPIVLATAERLRRCGCEGRRHTQRQGRKQGAGEAGRGLRRRVPGVVGITSRLHWEDGR